jgi:hypothetical protein
MMGPTVPVPVPPNVADALESVHVTHNDEGRSGFQLTFQIGRAGPGDIVDYSLLLSPLLRPFSRVVLIVTFNVRPRVLMDGIITNQQLAPGSEPGAAKVTVTGEDVSVMMDMEKKRAEYPAQDETMIALRLIAGYARFGLIPMIIPPQVIDPPIPVERVPVQQDTDLEYLNRMAARHGYTFYINPGPAPLTNTAYWGPPQRLGVPQRALSVNMGPQTNVDSINFQYNALAPAIVSDSVQDRRTNQRVPVRTFISTRPPLVSQPALPFNLPNVRTSLLENQGALDVMQAMSRAQALTDKSVDAVATASGELDALRYGDILQPRGLVGLRGAGYNHDGFYYVKSVTHTISKGQYKQRFSLTREGQGALAPMVIP